MTSSTASAGSSTTVFLNPKAYEEAMKNWPPSESGISDIVWPVPDWLYRIPAGECVVMDTSAIKKEVDMPIEDPPPRIIDYQDKLPAPPASSETMRKVWSALRTLHSGFTQMSSAVKKSNTDCKTLSAAMLKARGK